MKYRRCDLEKWAFTDDLTGLLNRRRVDMLLAERRAPCYFVSIDLDDFGKAQNAQPDGHLWGDRAIAAFGAFLISQTRQRDPKTGEPLPVPDLVAGRVGGDEFLVVVDSPLGAALVAERVRSWKHEGLTASAGVGVSHGQADKALYRAKVARKRGVSRAG